MRRFAPSAIIATLAAMILAGCNGGGPIGRALAPGADAGMERRVAGDRTVEQISGGVYSYESHQRNGTFRLYQGSLPAGDEAQVFQETIRDLAGQIADSLMSTGHAANQLIMLPTTFVNLDDLNRSSTFGRLCSEQLSAELLQLGANVVELRRTKEITITPQAGELGLSRMIEELSQGHQANVVLVGTYAVTPGQVVLSARLVRAGDNQVAAAGFAAFDRRNNLFVNSLLVKETRANLPSQAHLLAAPRAKVGVSNDFITYGQLKEQDLAAADKAKAQAQAATAPKPQPASGAVSKPAPRPTAAKSTRTAKSTVAKKAAPKKPASSSNPMYKAVKPGASASGAANEQTKK